MQKLKFNNITTIQITRSGIAFNPLQCYNPTSMSTIAQDTFVTWGNPQSFKPYDIQGFTIIDNIAYDYKFVNTNNDDAILLLL